MFIITTFLIIAGKNYQILVQILCPKTLELKIFEVKKCSESFFCCKYIFEISEIIYKESKCRSFLNLSSTAKDQAQLEKFIKHTGTQLKHRTFEYTQPIIHPQQQMVKVQGQVRSCREREFKILWFLSNCFKKPQFICFIITQTASNNVNKMVVF